MTKLITELGYLGFEVTSIEAWDSFASGVLGLAVVDGTVPGTKRLRMDNNAYRFILIDGPADDIAFVGWQTANATKLEEFSKQLDKYKVTWTWATDAELKMRSVEKMLHFSDPTGNRHEVYFGPELATDRFVSPAVTSGFLTGDGGLGHIVFETEKYSETLNFAQKILGMGTSDFIRLEISEDLKFEVAFLHTNSRHHSYAVAPTPPTSKQRKRVHHFMIEVNSVEEVGFARDRCLELGYPVTMDLGQHPNDKMISFYGQTPSGFHVEFGYGGVKVDGANWQIGTYPKLSEWGHRPSSEAPNNNLKTPKSSSESNADVLLSASDIDSIEGCSEWSVVIKTPLGENNVTFKLNIKGGIVSGEVVDADGSSVITDGVANGNSLTWKSKVRKPLPMGVTFSATIDGNKIVGGAKSPFGRASFAGTKK
jgi:biphenyl-2,3-diol 1,2-dioxygenase